MNQDRYAVTWMIIYIISACIIAVIFCGCKSTKYIPVETVRDVYHNTTDTIRDSINHTVYVNQYVKGDTVFKDRIEYLYKDRWRIRDSITVITDSVPIPYPVIEYVEKFRTPWHNWFIIGILFISLIYLLIKRFLK